MKRGVEHRVSASTTPQSPSQHRIPKSAIPKPQSRVQITPSTAQHRLGLLYSAPLVTTGQNGSLHPVEPWDFATERELIFDSLTEAGRAMEVYIESAGVDNLRMLLTNGCRVLHYSGYSHHRFLACEDDRGRAHALRPQALRELLADANSTVPDLVFVCALRARRTGEMFRAAGMPTVVVAETENLGEDRAAAAFVRAFYRALASGKTIMHAFEKGQAAIKAIPGGSSEQKRFMLLDQNGHRQIAPFAEAPLGTWRELAPPEPPNNLPGLTKKLTGRAVEMQRVVTALPDHCMVVLHGPAGIGKTALAIAAAGYLRQRRHFSDGVVFLSLRHAGSDQALRIALAQSLGLQSENDEELYDCLRTQDMLLILDGCESLLQSGVPDFLRTLDRLAPRSKFLLTSQQVPGSGLRGLPAKAIHQRPLARTEAARLFLNSAPRSLAAELGRPASEPMLIDLLARHPVLKCLGGHPHAILLAAPLLRNRSLVQLQELLASQLDHEPKQPTTSADQPSHDSAFLLALRAAVNDLRERQPNAVRLLGLMGLLPGGASPLDISLVWGEENWRDLMATLVQSSLVVHESGLENERFITSSFIAEFAERQLSQDDRTRFAQQMAAHLVIVCGIISSEMATSRMTGLTWLAQHEQNLRACLDPSRWQTELKPGQEPPPAGVIASTLPTLLIQAGRIQDATTAAQLGLQCHRALRDRQGEAKTLELLGNLRLQLGDDAGAREAFEQLLPLHHESIHDPVAEAALLKRLGGLRKRLGEMAAARDAYEQALALDRKCNNRLAEAGTLRVLGDLHRHMDNLEEAIEHLAQALVLHHQSQDLSGMAADLGGLARCANAAEQPVPALWLAEKALKIFQREADQHGQALALEDQAEAFVSLGEDQAVLAASWQALQLQRLLQPDDRPSLQALFDELQKEMPAKEYQELLRDLETHAETWRQRAVAAIRHKAERDPFLREIRDLLP